LAKRPPAEKPEEKKDDKSLPSKIKKRRIEVITVRNWKEYLGESVLIVFSVALALALTEWFTKLHEEKQTRQFLHELHEELITNRIAEEDQYAYHLKVLRNIDSALNNPAYAQQFMNNGVLHLYETIAPRGVMSRNLTDIAWQMAKQNNALAKIDLNTYSLLVDIYDDQARITKVEDEIGKVLLSWESRKPENLRATLILIRDNYHGWAVDRVPELLKKYARAIERLKNY